MRALAGFVLLACHALAHVMSMSSGDLTIRGTLAHYEFRLPLYEMPHVVQRQQIGRAHV